MYGYAVLKAAEECDRSEKIKFDRGRILWRILPYLVSLAPLFRDWIIKGDGAMDIKEIILEVITFVVLTKIIIYSIRKQ